MPNWASCNLTTTNPEIIAVLKDCHEREDRKILGAFYPVPEELQSVITGSCTIDGVTVHRWREDDDGSNRVAIPAEELARMTAEHGTDNWYDWSVKNWGTKWDAANTGINISQDGTIATVWFDAAWSPPQRWLAKVVDDHPEGTTSLAYAEGGSAFWGVVMYVDGNVITDRTSDNFWSDELDEDEFALPTPECQDHLDEWGLHTGG